MTNVEIIKVLKDAQREIELKDEIIAALEKELAELKKQ